MKNSRISVLVTALIYFFTLPQNGVTARLFPKNLSVENVGSTPLQVVTSDFNNDGFPDLAVANQTPGSISIFIGNGNGLFSLAIGSPISLPGNLTGGVGDVVVNFFDGDNNSDLGVTLFSNLLTILKGNGDGTFGMGPSMSTGSVPGLPAAIDFNEDNIMDIIVPNYSDGDLSLYMASSGGSFTILGSTVPVTTNPQSIITGKINSDLHEDIIVFDSVNNNASVLLGNGNSTFNLAPGSPLPCDVETAIGAIGDLDSDGKNDFVVVNFFASNMNVFLGNGDGSFNQAPGSPIDVGLNPHGVVLGDFNNDGKQDVATSNTGSDDVRLLLGDGNGSFTPAEDNPKVGDFPNSLIAGDINVDGRLDIVTANTNSKNLTILFGNKEPSLTNPTFTNGVIQITYTDNEGELPDSSTGGSITAEVDGVAVSVTQVDSSDTDVTDGKAYRINGSFSSGTHGVKFIANDGTYTTVLSQNVTVPQGGGGGCSLISSDAPMPFPLGRVTCFDAFLFGLSLLGLSNFRIRKQNSRCN